jgi:hypothetical protein
VDEARADVKAMGTRKLISRLKSSMRSSSECIRSRVAKARVEVDAVTEAVSEAEAEAEDRTRTIETKTRKEVKVVAAHIKNNRGVEARTEAVETIVAAVEADQTMIENLTQLSKSNLLLVMRMTKADATTIETTKLTITDPKRIIKRVVAVKPHPVINLLQLLSPAKAFTTPTLLQISKKTVTKKIRIRINGVARSNTVATNAKMRMLKKAKIGSLTTTSSICQNRVQLSLRRRMRPV